MRRNEFVCVKSPIRSGLGKVGIFNPVNCVVPARNEYYADGVAGNSYTIIKRTNLWIPQYNAPTGPTSKPFLPVALSPFPIQFTGQFINYKILHMSFSICRIITVYLSR